MKPTEICDWLLEMAGIWQFLHFHIQLNQFRIGMCDRIHIDVCANPLKNAYYRACIPPQKHILCASENMRVETLFEAVPDVWAGDFRIPDVCRKPGDDDLHWSVHVQLYV